MQIVSDFSSIPVLQPVICSGCKNTFVKLDMSTKYYCKGCNTSTSKASHYRNYGKPDKHLSWRRPLNQLRKSRGENA